MSTFEAWLERVGDDAFEGLSFSRPMISGPGWIGGAIAAICEVDVSQRFKYCKGVAFEGSQTLANDGFDTLVLVVCVAMSLTNVNQGCKARNCSLAEPK